MRGRAGRTGEGTGGRGSVRRSPASRRRTGSLGAVKLCECAEREAGSEQAGPRFPTTTPSATARSQRQPHPRAGSCPSSASRGRPGSGGVPLSILSVCPAALRAPAQRTERPAEEVRASRFELDWAAANYVERGGGGVPRSSLQEELWRLMQERKHSSAVASNRRQRGAERLGRAPVRARARTSSACLLADERSLRSGNSALALSRLPSSSSELPALARSPRARSTSSARARMGCCCSTQSRSAFGAAIFSLFVCVPALFYSSTLYSYRASPSLPFPPELLTDAASPAHRVRPARLAGVHGFCHRDFRRRSFLGRPGHPRDAREPVGPSRVDAQDGARGRSGALAPPLSSSRRSAAHIDTLCSSRPSSASSTPSGPRSSSLRLPALPSLVLSRWAPCVRFLLSAFSPASLALTSAPSFAVHPRRHLPPHRAPRLGHLGLLCPPARAAARRRALGPCTSRRFRRADGQRRQAPAPGHRRRRH